MNTLSKILIGLLAGVALIGWLFYGVQGCSDKKTIQSIQSELKACQNAPVKIVRQVTHDTVHDAKWFTPKKVVLHDTITVEKVKWCRFDYSDLYQFGAGDSTGNFVINIHDKDCQPIYNISELHYPVIHRTITKTVVHDTAIYVPKLHWGFTIGA